MSLRGLSIPGVLVGFVTTVATTIVASLLSLALFADLIEEGPDDVLMIATGPLLYALLALSVATVLGVWVCASLSRTPAAVNALGIVVLYAVFSYLLSRSPSNLDNPYPHWFEVARYLVLLPAAAFGHGLSLRRAATE